MAGSTGLGPSAREILETSEDELRQPVGGLECSFVERPEILEARGAVPDGPDRGSDAVASRTSHERGDLMRQVAPGVVADHADRQKPDQLFVADGGHRRGFHVDQVGLDTTGGVHPSRPREDDPVDGQQPAL